MNRAEQHQLALDQKRMTWAELLRDAEECADEYTNEQDFDNHIRYFEWPDGSVSAFFEFGNSLRAYGVK